MSQSEKSPKLSGTRHLRIEELRLDPEYQRSIRDQFLRDLIRKFDVSLFGTIEVSERDGQYWVVDGQHRVAALRAMGWTNVQIPCLIHRGLSEQQEASHFKRFNTQRKTPTAYDLFKAGVVEGDERAVAVSDVLSSVGLRALPNNTPQEQSRDGVRAIHTLLEIEKYHGGDMLARVLTIASQAWPSDPASGRSRDILDALVAFISTHAARGHVVDDPSLIRACSKIGANALLSRGREIRGSLAAYKVMAAEIQMPYNRSVKPSSRVEELAPGQYTKRPRRPSGSANREEAVA